MITVQKASEIIFSRNLKTHSRNIDLRDSHGNFLDENLYADRDFPPFDRVAMDGIAVQYPDCTTHLELSVQSSQYAGEEKHTLENSDKCIEIATGASLPNGCNAVVPYELLKISKGKATNIDFSKTAVWSNIHKKGTDLSKGSLLIGKGNQISAHTINVAATIGKDKVRTRNISPFAIIATGDELVPVDQVPSPFQIRRSNVHAIQALLDKWKVESTIFHLKDDKKQLLNSLRGIIQNFPHIILSGGVSAGKKDYIPEVLEELGVVKKFHKVAQRPGKPFWYGNSNENIVFGLPGNPVSSIVGCYRYIIPLIYKSLTSISADKLIEDFPSKVILGEDIHFRKNLTKFQQVRIENHSGKQIAIPIPSNGSGDFANLVDAGGFIELPSERNIFREGEVLDIWGD